MNEILSKNKTREELLKEDEEQQLNYYTTCVINEIINTSVLLSHSLGDKF